MFAAQLDAGAWGITVATGNQLLAAYSFGVRRLLVANEILDPTVLRWIARVRATPRSCSTSTRSRRRRRGRADGGRVRVLLEVGLRRRPDVRSAPATRPWRWRSAIAATAGVDAPGRQRVRGRLRDVDGPRVPGRGPRRRRDAGRRGAAAGARAPVGGRVRVTSTRSPTCWRRLHGRLPSTTILRSGSYVTHDHGTYVASTPFTRIAGTSTRRCGSGPRCSRPPRTGSRSSAPASATCPTTPACRWCSRHRPAAPVVGWTSRAPTTSTPTWRATDPDPLAGRPAGARHLPPVHGLRQVAGDPGPRRRPARGRRRHHLVLKSSSRRAPRPRRSRP